jgi:hypothetical protein
MKSICVHYNFLCVDLDVLYISKSINVSGE